MTSRVKTYKPCSFCKRTDIPTKLCYCESAVICNQDCWRKLCELDPAFKTKCKTALYGIKAKELKAKLKSTTAGTKQFVRNELGQFGATNEKKKKSAKSEEQIKKDAIQSQAAAKKKAIIKGAKEYNIFKPFHKLGIREVAPAGPPKMWYQTNGYNALESRSILPENEGANNENVQVRVEPIDVDDVEPDVEDLNFEIQQLRETKKDRIRKYCGICTEPIGPITGRVRCSVSNCVAHYSLHLACLGFYPMSVADRKVIQKSFFCQDHKPGLLQNTTSTPSIPTQPDETTPIVPTFGGHSRIPLMSKEFPSTMTEKIKPSFRSRVATKSATSHQVTLDTPGPSSGTPNPSFGTPAQSFIGGFVDQNQELNKFIHDNAMDDGNVDQILGIGV